MNVLFATADPQLEVVSLTEFSVGVDALPDNSLSDSSLWPSFWDLLVGGQLGTQDDLCCSQEARDCCH